MIIENLRITNLVPGTPQRKGEIKAYFTFSDGRIGEVPVEDQSTFDKIPDTVGYTFKFPVEWDKSLTVDTHATE